MTNVSERFQQSGIVPVIKFTDTAQASPLAEILVQEDLAIAEVTLRTPCALDCINSIHKNFPQILLGAGTVLSVEQAKAAVISGASFIVCPCLVPDVINWCIENRIPVYPGICTPTEIYQAKQLGLTELKFFPASNYGGVGTLKSFKAVFNEMSFMPTGGVTLDNCDQYLTTPGVICCGGTFIAPTGLMENGEFEKIKAIVRQTVTHIAAIRPH